MIDPTKAKRLHALLSTWLGFPMHHIDVAAATDLMIDGSLNFSVPTKPGVTESGLAILERAVEAMEGRDG